MTNTTMNTTIVFNHVYEACHDALQNHTAVQAVCLPAKNAMDSLPLLAQKVVCAVGFTTYTGVLLWMSTFDKLGYYGGWLTKGGGYEAELAGGIAAQVVWIVLTAAVAKRAASYMLSGREEKIITSTKQISLNSADELSKHMLDNKYIPRS